MSKVTVAELAVKLELALHTIQHENRQLAAALAAAAEELKVSREKEKELEGRIADLEATVSRLVKEVANHRHENKELKFNLDLVGNRLLILESGKKKGRPRPGDKCPSCAEGVVMVGRTKLGCSRWRLGCKWTH